MTAEHPQLCLRRIVKRFDDVTAVAGVDLDVERNEIVALVGPSGCGKSTLLRVIAGLHPADEGTVAMGGALVDDGTRQVPPERRRIGLVFQDHALFPHLTVADNIGFGLRDVEAPERQRRVGDMLSLVSLDGFGGRYPHELSGGERQRVALARALAPAPDIMLLDEPFASLDHNLRVQLRADVVDALRATQTAAVFVTHDQSEALAIGDRIVVMRAGRCEQVGTPAEVFHEPANRFTASFMGDASFLGIDGDARTVLGPLDVAAVRSTQETSTTVAMVRPDDVRFEPDPSGTARVGAAEYRGSHWLLTVEVPGGEVLQAHASQLLTPAPDDRGYVTLVDGHRQVPVAD